MNLSPGHADIKLAGSARPAHPLRSCQSKACGGAERVPEGGCQVTGSKWICAGCWSIRARRMSRC